MMANPTGEVAHRIEMERASADEELEDVLTLLRREETDHIRCGRPRHAEYVLELISKLERGEHRR